MPTSAVLPRILGALFYYSPGRPEVKALFDSLPTLPELYPWRDPAQMVRLCADWPLPDADDWRGSFPCYLKGRGKCPHRRGVPSGWNAIIC